MDGNDDPQHVGGRLLETLDHVQLREKYSQQFYELVKAMLCIERPDDEQKLQKASSPPIKVTGV